MKLGYAGAITLDLPVPVAPTTAMRGSMIVLLVAKKDRRVVSMPSSTWCL